MVHKNSVILAKARKASNTSGGYYFCILLVLISELIIYYKNRPRVPSYFVELASLFVFFTRAERCARRAWRTIRAGKKKQKEHKRSHIFCASSFLCYTPLIRSHLTTWTYHKHRIWLPCHVNFVNKSWIGFARMKCFEVHWKNYTRDKANQTRI